MNTSTIDIKCRVGKMEKIISREYDEPEDFAEGIEMDTEARAFKTYLNKRKTNFMDKERSIEVKRMEKEITKALQDPAIVAKLAEMGINL